MTTVRRNEKVTVELGGVVSIDDEKVTTVLPDANALPPIVTGATSRRSTRRAGGRAANRSSLSVETEWQAIEAALAAQDLTVVDAIPLRTDAIIPPPTSATRRARRRGKSAETSTAALVSTVGVNVAVDDEEQIVVLLEQDGVYSWNFGEVHTTATAPAKTARKGAKRAGKKRATKSSEKRVAHFQLEIAPSRVVERPTDGRRRRSILGKVAGKAVAYVLRFAAKPVLTRATKWIERDIKAGLIHINGTDATAWPHLGMDGTMPIPATGQARVLLFVHGTFSSTLGSFGALGASDSGREFLETALRSYDLVIGWNHRTLSVAPDVNAQDICDWFQAQKWAKPPVVDAIAYSRGGLVFRSLVEEKLPGAKQKVEIRRAVFVGSTNGGTELAHPGNWHKFADTYFNLAAAGARALGLVPGINMAGLILGEAISGVGSLVKVLATSAVDDNAIPGLSAMNPTGPFITRINQRQEGQPSPTTVQYYAITSHFDPDEAVDEGRSNELPTGFLLKLADKALDALQGKPNDLVVNVDAMTRIDPQVGSFIRERLDFGTNGTVHHCRYFIQDETADSLSRWLMPAT